MAFTEQEFLAVSTAADRLGMATAAYVGAVVLSVAMRRDPPEWSPLTDLMREVMRAAGQVRRVGVNLNQAVAAVQSLGRPTRALEEYAQAAAKSVRDLDEVAEQLRTKLS